MTDRRHTVAPDDPRRRRMGVLTRYLRRPRTVAEIAQHLGRSRAAAYDWLRALSDSGVTVVTYGPGYPRKYVISQGE